MAVRGLALLLVAAATSALAVLDPPTAVGLLLLAGVVIGSLGLQASHRLPVTLGVVAVLGLYFHIGIGSIDLPGIVLLSVPTFGIASLQREETPPPLPSWLKVAGGCLLAGLVIGVVRGPAGRLGLRPLVTIAWLTLILRLAVMWARDGRLMPMLRAYSATAAAFGVLNLVFFLFPSLEDAYFSSWISHVFVEPDSVRHLLTGDVLNNALSHDKAATLYINANVAGMFFGTAAWVGYGSWKSTTPRAVVVGACFLGALGTASRGALVGGFASLVVWTMLQIHRGRVVRLLGRSAIVGTGLVALGVGIAELQTGGFSRFAWNVVSADPRLILWAAAVELGRTRPLLGSGFGAWEAFWPPIARIVNLRPSFPPHNVYLYLWVVGGLLSVAGFLALGVGAIVRARSIVRFDATMATTAAALASAAVVAWCWTQANFENFFFLDYKLGFLLAAVLGVLVHGSAPSRPT